MPRPDARLPAELAKELFHMVDAQLLDRLLDGLAVVTRGRVAWVRVSTVIKREWGSDLGSGGQRRGG
jgi:hypothetical protein